MLPEMVTFLHAMFRILRGILRKKSYFLVQITFFIALLKISAKRHPERRWNFSQICSGAFTISKLYY